MKGVWKFFLKHIGNGKADERAVKRAPGDPQDDKQNVGHCFGLTVSYGEVWNAKNLILLNIKNVMVCYILLSMIQQWIKPVSTQP